MLAVDELAQAEDALRELEQRPADGAVS